MNWHVWCLSIEMWLLVLWIVCMFWIRCCPSQILKKKTRPALCFDSGSNCLSCSWYFPWILSHFLCNWYTMLLHVSVFSNMLFHWPDIFFILWPERLQYTRLRACGDGFLLEMRIFSCGIVILLKQTGSKWHSAVAIWTTVLQYEMLCCIVIPRHVVLFDHHYMCMRLSMYAQTGRVPFARDSQSTMVLPPRMVMAVCGWRKFNSAIFCYFFILLFLVLVQLFRSSMFEVIVACKRNDKSRQGKSVG